jgi:hypothetical protein
MANPKGQIMPDDRGVWGLTREENQQLAIALLQRADVRTDAEKAFRAGYPNAPGSMVQTAVHHVYNDGPDAVIRWLADAELFLRDPSHRLCSGVTSDLLYHVYNWHQFQEILPVGKPGLVELLDDIKLFVDEGSLDAAKKTVDDLKEMLNGTVNYPDFDCR